MPSMGLASHAGKTERQRPLSSTFASKMGLAFAMRYISPEAHKDVEYKKDEPQTNKPPILTPPASPPQFKRPQSTTDVLYMHEDGFSDVIVIQRATRIPIVSQSDGNLREVTYHKGRPVGRPEP